MFVTDLKVHDETKVQHLIDDTLSKKVHHLFNDVHEKALTGKYIVLHQKVEQAVVKAIYL